MAKQPRTDLNFEEFRQILVEERSKMIAMHLGQRADMRAEAEDASVESAAQDSDSAASLSERGRDEAFDENMRTEIYQIDAALERLTNGTYGYCELTGEPIPIERLQAIPWATMTVKAAERTGR